MFKDGIRGDPLQSIMADGAADVSQGFCPGVRWFYGFTCRKEPFDKAHISKSFQRSEVFKQLRVNMKQLATVGQRGRRQVTLGVKPLHDDRRNIARAPWCDDIRMDQSVGLLGESRSSASAILIMLASMLP